MNRPRAARVSGATDVSFIFHMRTCAGSVSQLIFLITMILVLLYELLDYLQWLYGIDQAAAGLANMTHELDGHATHESSLQSPCYLQNQRLAKEKEERRLIGGSSSDQSNVGKLIPSTLFTPT